MIIKGIRQEKKRDLFLYDTRVENLFINEFLPQADGDYVKVYLFALMCEQNEQSTDIRMMARTLGMTEKRIIEAFEYWGRKGLVKFVPTNQEGCVEVEFTRLTQAMYGHVAAEEPKEAEPEQAGGTKLGDEVLRKIFAEYEAATGKTVSSHEINKIKDCIYVYEVSPEVFSYAIRYCVDIEKGNIDYICKVATRWAGEGYTSIAQVKEMEEKLKKRQSFYQAIFKEMGFNRLPAPSDKELMDRWFDEWGYSLAEVLDSCKKTAGQRERSLRYVNKVLENRLYQQGGINTAVMTGASSENAAAADGQKAMVSKQVLEDYYTYLREEALRLQDARIEEVCREIPKMQIVYSAINDLNFEIIDAAKNIGNKEKREAIREKKRAAEKEKLRLLTEYGYDEDYLEIKYMCPTCKDSGTTDEGRICACRAARAEEAFRWIREGKTH